MTFTANIQLLIMVSSVLIPILHGLIGKAAATPGSKVALTIALSAVAGFISTVIESEGVFSMELVTTTFTTFIGAIAMHYGIFKPIEVTGSEGKVQALTQGKGVALKTDVVKQTNLPWA